MATTAQKVFDAAMAIIDELDESGNADTEDTKEYKDKTLFILNILRGELYPLSDTYKISEKGKRPICKAITSFTTSIDLDDYLCQSVMPYGLAAHLIIDENPSNAAFCNQRYEELKRSAANLPTQAEEIEDCYGGIGFEDGGRW